MAATGASRGEIRQFWRTFSRNQLAVCGSAVVLVLVTLAVLAPLLAPWDHNEADISPDGTAAMVRLARDAVFFIKYIDSRPLAAG